MPLHRHCITHKYKVVRQIGAHRGQAFKLWSLLGILHWKPGQGFFNVVLVHEHTHFWVHVNMSASPKPKPEYATFVPASSACLIGPQPLDPH